MRSEHDLNARASWKVGAIFSFLGNELRLFKGHTNSLRFTAQTEQFMNVLPFINLYFKKCIYLYLLIMDNLSLISIPFETHAKLKARGPKAFYVALRSNSKWLPQLIKLRNHKNGHNLVSFSITELKFGVVVFKSHSQPIL